MQKKNQGAETHHHAHFGLFLTLGVLVVVLTAVGSWHLYKESVWLNTFKGMQDEQEALLTQLEVYQQDLYHGPYGVLSYVRYNQVHPVDALAPESLLLGYDQLTCDALQIEGEEIPEGHMLMSLGEDDRARLLTLVEEKLSLDYTQMSACLMDENRLLVLATDARNTAFRVPLLLGRTNTDWDMRALPPLPGIFSMTTRVYMHPEGNPILFDMRETANEVAWRAHYIDLKAQTIDTLESCRVAKQGGTITRSCERLYDQVL